MYFSSINFGTFSPPSWNGGRILQQLPMSFRAEQQTNKHKKGRGHSWLECLVSHMTRSTRLWQNSQFSNTVAHSTAAGTFLNLLTDIKYYFAPDFKKSGEKMRLQTHLGQVQAFYLECCQQAFVCFYMVWNFLYTRFTFPPAEGNVAFLCESANRDFDW